jgi:glycosyltransferase involved in cell wall biosynthesis
MKLLFLRGQVPQDRDPQEIVFDRIEDNDDMWTQLAFEMAKGDEGQIWYWGGKRKQRFSESFLERWIPNLGLDRHDFDPDVIFCRGGFEPYDKVLKRHPRAFKIYYGAGIRYLPKFGFKDYDLILVDSERQLQAAREQHPKIKSDLLIKPAAENIFQPAPPDIKYDVMFSVNHARMKGVDFFLKHLPSDLKAIIVGNVPVEMRRKHPHVTFTGRRIPRAELPAYYAQSKVAVCCSTSYDSCPRVIPESLACNTPIVVLDSVHVWRGRYINESTGKVSSPQDFFTTVRDVVRNVGAYEPKEYYDEHLSISACKERILRNI